MAIIDSVDAREGEFLFPANSARINSVLAFKLTRVPRLEDGDDALELVFSGQPYIPSIDGEVGDTIELVYDKKIPMNGELAIEHVRTLRVKRKAHSA